MAVYENDTDYFFRGHLSLHPEHGVKFTQNPPKSVQGGSRVMAIEVAVPKVVFDTPQLSATITVNNEGAADFNVDAVACSDALKAIVGADVSVTVGPMPESDEA